MWDFRDGFKMGYDPEFLNAFIGWTGSVQTNANRDVSPYLMLDWRKELWRRLGMGSDVNSARVEAYLKFGVTFWDQYTRDRERPFGNTWVP